MNRVKLPRTPNHLDEIPGRSPFEEQLLSMVVALTSELTILRARLDVNERLLAEAGVIAPDAVDAFSPDAAAQAARDAQRERIMRKVFRPLQEAAIADLAAITPSSSQEN